MDYRNRKLVIAVRILLGLFLIMSGIGGFWAVAHGLEGIPAPMLPYMSTLIDTKIFHLIKVTEIVAGLMLVIGFLPALATLFIAPLCVGILVFHLSVAPALSDMWGGLVVAILTIYLGYAYWDKYKQLFKA